MEVDTEVKGKGPRYLGDGLYASFDGWQFHLYTETSSGASRMEVWLEPEVICQLTSYIRDIYEAFGADLPANFNIKTKEKE